MSLDATPSPNRYRIPTWTLGDRLRKARTSAGVRVDEMAAHLRVSTDTITNYEKDKTTPRRAVLMAYAAQCNVPLGWLEDPDFEVEETETRGRDERRAVAATSNSTTDTKPATRRRTAIDRQQEVRIPHDRRTALPVKYAPHGRLRVLPSAS